MSSTPTVTVRYSSMSDEEMDALFASFINRFQKSYNEAEKRMRMEIFRTNLARIDEMNSLSSHATYGITQFTDLTRAEFQSQLTNGKVSDQAKEYARRTSKAFNDLDADGCQACTRFPKLAQYSENNLPTSFDWRDYGAVTEVKNQAYCGSCWAFSTTGAIEGAWYVTDHALISLSEQQLVTCDTEWNQGCNGGWPSLAMDYVKDNGGIIPETIYPYRKVNMVGPNTHAPICRSVVKDGNYASTLSSEFTVASSELEENKMAWWLVKNGPLSVSLDATGMDYYEGGIDYGQYCDPNDINHAVLLVGYGEENGVKYWIIKNSWAIWWGERGYYKLLRGVNACGIASDVAAVLVGDASVE
ncbi:unnamed protein product [Choristocarpus tenellus]